MDIRKIIIDKAQEMGVYSPDGRFALSSLMILDFVTMLEDVVGFEVPVEEITETNFDSVDAVVQMLERVRPS